MNLLNAENEEEIPSGDDEQFDPDCNILEEEKTKEQMKLIKRGADEKMFDDEVEYEANTEVRNRYQKYKYMRSFIKNEWNIYDSLPNYYKKLFVFENIARLNKRVKEMHS